jgi:hypothetical protein
MRSSHQQEVHKKEENSKQWWKHLDTPINTKTSSHLMMGHSQKKPLLVNLLFKSKYVLVLVNSLLIV